MSDKSLSSLLVEAGQAGSEVSAAPKLGLLSSNWIMAAPALALISLVPMFQLRQSSIEQNEMLISKIDEATAVLTQAADVDEERNIDYDAYFERIYSMPHDNQEVESIKSTISDIKYQLEIYGRLKNGKPLEPEMVTYLDKLEDPTP